jgi:P-type Cu+ transporter
MKKTFHITGMHCASCAVNIQNQISEVEGIKNSSVNYANEQATVEFEGELPAEALSKAISSLGYKAHLDTEPEDTAKEESDKEIKTLRIKLAVSGILTGILIIGAMVPFAPAIIKGHVFMWVLATPVQFWAGLQYYKSAWAGFKNRLANMDTLIAIGTSVAYFFSVAAILFESELMVLRN